MSSYPPRWVGFTYLVFAAIVAVYVGFLLLREAWRFLLELCG